MAHPHATRRISLSRRTTCLVFGTRGEKDIEGNTIVQALTAVQYDENELKRRMKAQIDEAIKSDRLKPSEGMRLLDDYERGLRDYTYLTF